MRVFKDTAGRSWALAINVDTVQRVRGTLKLDLLDMSALDKLTDDPCLLCDVLFCIVEPDAKTQNVTPADFGRAMGGDALEAATAAFLEELTDFFPNPKRQILKKALRKTAAIQARVVTLANERLDSTTLDAEIEATIQKAFSA